MKYRRTAALLLASVITLSGCASNVQTIDTGIESSIETVVTISSGITETTEITETTKTLVPFEFNPHVYSPKLAERIPQDYWDSLYNLCDALREGEDVFECTSEEAYEWCVDAGTLSNLFPAAGMMIDNKTEDGSPAFEDGTGKINYKIPVEEFVARQQEFETLITNTLNYVLESDDTDYEKALKLYVYVAENFVYSDEEDLNDNFVYYTFMSKNGKCINFASVYAYLLLQVGIDALNIGCFEDGMDHAWTYVVINGKGYHIDTTWTLHTVYDTYLEDTYMDYFMMSDAERNADGCLVRDLTVQLLPEFWVSRTDMSFEATDNSYNLRDLCAFVSLDEDNKILYYNDSNGDLREFHYDI